MKTLFKIYKAFVFTLISKNMSNLSFFTETELNRLIIIVLPNLFFYLIDITKNDLEIYYPPLANK